jgi:hypothetical protein
LQETRPSGERFDAEFSAMLDLPPEIARVERARAEAMRARGTEDDPPPAEPLSPFAVFGEGLRLEATGCLRLLELKFPLVDFLKSSDRGERPEAPAPRATLVAVGRSDYRVRVEEVTPWQFAFLKSCERPAQLYEAVCGAALEAGEETPQVLAEVAVWLPVAFNLGFLRRVA